MVDRDWSRAWVKVRALLLVLALLLAPGQAMTGVRWVAQRVAEERVSVIENWLCGLSRTAPGAARRVPSVTPTRGSPQSVDPTSTAFARPQAACRS